MDKTEHLDLNLPEPSDYVEVVKLSENFEKLDAHAKKVDEGLKGTAPANHTHTPEAIGAAAKTHAHSAADVGALPSSGGTLTGNLNIEKSGGAYYNIIEKTSGSEFAMMVQTAGTILLKGTIAGILKGISFRNTGKVADDFRIHDGDNTYGIYHTGNKPTAADVGAYSLKDMEAIPSGADLNDYLTPGSYRCGSGAIAATLKNSPVTNTGFTLHVKHISSANYIRQSIEVNSASLYDQERSVQNGTFYNWAVCYNSGTVTAGTSDLTAGSSSLLNDRIYQMYE